MGNYITLRVDGNHGLFDKDSRCVKPTNNPNQIGTKITDKSAVWQAINEHQGQLDCQTETMKNMLQEIKCLQVQFTHPNFAHPISVSEGPLKPDLGEKYKFNEPVSQLNHHQMPSNTQMNSSRSYSMQVPSPEPFCVSSGRSFDKFIEQFEIYCRSKYAEHTYECWSGELANFLKDDCLLMYNVVGGGDLDYSVIKAKLRTHCDGKSKSYHACHLDTFHATVCSPGESLYLYAHRLERLFSAAYPGVDTDTSRELHSRFVVTIPAEEAMMIRILEDQLKILLNTDFIQWSRLVAILHRQHDLVARQSTSSWSIFKWGFNDGESDCENSRSNKMKKE